MLVRRISAAAALLGVGLAAQASAAGTPVKVTATQPVAITPAPATASAADAAPSGPVGKVEIKELVFDAGKVDRGTDVSHAFTIKNVGPGDLTVDAKPG